MSAVSSENQIKNSPHRWVLFYFIFIVLHFMTWVFLPILTKPNYPLDTIESFIYGQEWAFSSGKHPPLPSWMTEFVSLLTCQSEIAPYLCSQIVVLAAFFSIWIIAWRMLPPQKALLAVCSMEFYTYFTFYSLEFNNSMALLGCWSLAVLSFYFALENGKWRYWILIGFFLGLGVLAKYSGFILVLLMSTFMFYDSNARKYWKTPKPYVTTLIAVLAFLPHFLSVLFNHFQTIQYFAERVEVEGHAFYTHFFFLFRFLLTQLGILAPILLVFAVFSEGKFKRRKLAVSEKFNARFLNMLVIWPLIFQILISAIFALKLSTIYGSHLWIFIGLYLAFFLELDVKRLTLKRLSILFVTALILMATLTMVRDIASPYLRGKPSRIHYPGAEIAKVSETIWHEYYDFPCPFLVGEWWLTGAVAAYGNDNPKVYCHFAPDHFCQGGVLSTWVDPSQISLKGGIGLWDESHYPQKVPPELLEQYPTAKIQPTVEIPYQTGANIPPLKLGIAIIPPQSQ